MISVAQRIEHVVALAIPCANRQPRALRCNDTTGSKRRIVEEALVWIHFNIVGVINGNEP